ncbi:uncharacterized protein [Drosophila tropicalis]|uniref:uncharacterized protein n=1 Tax=Drosophila tropicalis TaxID=46794 RepID=UPI0035AC1F6E
MEKLKATRTKLKSSLTRLLTLSENPPENCTADVVDTMMTRLDNVWKEFDRSTDDMFEFQESQGYVDPMGDYGDYEMKYLTAQLHLKELGKLVNPVKATKVVDSSEGVNEVVSQILHKQMELQREFYESMTVSGAACLALGGQVQLPKLHIKPFGGDYLEWPAFKDLYESTIHNRVNLDKAQKFQYLKSFLCDEAASLINHLPLTGAAYETAWAGLMERYDRPRHVVNSLLDNFRRLPSTRVTDVSVLRKIADGASEVVRGLDALGQTNRDCWVIYFLLDKIDAESQCKWVSYSRKITTLLPKDEVDPAVLKVFDGLELADLPETSAKHVDILLGSDYVWSAFTGEKVLDKHGNIIAISTIFGFWELEELSGSLPPTADDLKVENHFRSTHFRDSNGRYSVELPFKNSDVKFADTLQGATSRFYSVERRLQKDKRLKEEYTKFMREYIALGHMRILDESEKTSAPKEHMFYMPHHPVIAAKILLEDFYVDDVLTGTNTEDQLIRNKDELIQLLGRAQLELGKWVSNTDGIGSLEEAAATSVPGDASSVKVLGIHCEPKSDIFTYGIRLSECTESSKRQVLSDVSRIFDPLGLLAPVIVQFKILFQELWLLNLDWDSPLPTKLADRWRKYREDIINIRQLKIRRHIGYVGRRIELHAFSDASIKAYAAVVYSRIVNQDGSIEVSLIAAKTRVAPLKQQSLPRLELCGALLLSRLIASIKLAWKDLESTVYAWCDSTIVLAWLNHLPASLKTFIGNRTAEILEVIPRDSWRHVNTKQNPADCASRGMLAEDLLPFTLWWKGPDWLAETHLNLGNEDDIQISNLISEDEYLKELKATVLVTLAETMHESSPLEELIGRVSSWPRLVRIVAYILRFIRHMKNPQEKSDTFAVTYDEYKAARNLCLQQAQDEWYKERKALRNEGCVPKGSKLCTLTPILDDNGLLRVGGRLNNSELSYSAKHPLILPRKHRISHLILEHEHQHNLHPGVSALFVIVRQRFWIMGARNLIRKVTHNCIKCFRQRAHTSNQLMAALPALRVRQAFPFENTGCDYAGPIMMKTHKGRTARKEKGYICLFVCMATSALHLELATDLSTDTFLAALRRFISRRGKCVTMFSDNGRNFVGAKRSLNEMEQLVQSQLHNNKIAEALSIEGINWKFIPPHAPHWGGKWESGVRSVKLHLHRVIGHAVLTFEQMHTLLTQVEAVINSRPLCATSDTDVGYLSPAHMLIGRPYTSVPDGDLDQVPANRLDYWQQSQAMLQGFWKRWHLEYLTSLQQRPKWLMKSANPRPDDLVLVKDSHTPPASWILARIIETIPGPDGLVRAL